ncbi:hypothetical protein [Tepidibacter aestuarii]|uniref:hypothetical protein n=1 Tax=Tepidibacter aestuarii TaxID=2925782 RepID=UPI0020BE32C4|nr:hypothetical protein [Tepidibacter aestuarii]CAH2213096.1 protein of unknown function [Tepidibacter aestuarii]
MSTLSQIKDMVQQLSEAVSTAFRVDVEIIDDNFCRISGTGSVQKYLGETTKKTKACK